MPSWVGSTTFPSLRTTAAIILPASLEIDTNGTGINYRSRSSSLLYLCALVDSKKLSSEYKILSFYSFPFLYAAGTTKIQKTSFCMSPVWPFYFNPKLFRPSTKLLLLQRILWPGKIFASVSSTMMYKSSQLLKLFKTMETEELK